MKCQCGLLTDGASTCNDCVSAIRKNLDEKTNEVERLKRGLFEIRSRGYSSRSKDYLDLPSVAEKILKGESRSFCDNLLASHVAAHDKTRSELDRMKGMYEAVKEERDKIQMDAVSANLQIKKLKEDVEHWIFARKTALAGGDLLKEDLEKANLEIEAIKKVALDALVGIEQGDEGIELSTSTVEGAVKSAIAVRDAQIARLSGERLVAAQAEVEQLKGESATYHQAGIDWYKSWEAVNLQVQSIREECAKIVDTFDTAQWSDTQRNVVRIVANRLRESFTENRLDADGRRDPSKPPRPGMIWRDKYKLWMDPDTRTEAQREKDEATAKEVEKRDIEPLKHTWWCNHHSLLVLNNQRCPKCGTP